MPGPTDDAEEDFDAAVFRVVREAAAEVVAEGVARLEEDHDQGGKFLRLVPANDAACAVTVYPGYPTLCLGREEQHCTEMFGDETTNLHDLRQLIEAVIAGRYEWEHRQLRRRRILPPFSKYSYTQLAGTFHTANGPWTFTREGAEPRGAVQRRTYEPYRT